MEKEIRIQAQILSDEVCQFVVDVPVYEDRSIFFANKESTKTSPLAEKLFELEGVVAVLVSHNTVKVTSNGLVEWMSLAKQIGPVVRAQLVSGQAAVSEAALLNLPTEEEIRQRVEQLFSQQINPSVGQHGGFVELVGVKQNAVYLRLGGGCQGCGMANYTLRQGIERAIRESIPEIGDILDVTDHASGRNPYFASSYK